MKHNKVKFISIITIVLLFTACTTIPSTGQNEQGLLVVQLQEERTYEELKGQIKLSIIEVGSNKTVKSLVTPISNRIMVFKLRAGTYYLQAEDIRDNQFKPEKISFLKQTVEAGHIHIYKNKYLVDLEKQGSRYIIHSDGWAYSTKADALAIKEYLSNEENLSLWIWEEYTE